MVKLIKKLKKRKFHKSGNSEYMLMPKLWKPLIGFEDSNGNKIDEYEPMLLQGKHGIFIGLWGEFQKKKVL